MGTRLREQEGPGKYNEEAWEAMDRVLEEARRAGLKVILSFLDNWKYNGAGPGTASRSCFGPADTG